MAPKSRKVGLRTPKACCHKGCEVRRKAFRIDRRSRGNLQRIRALEAALVAVPVQGDEDEEE